MIGRCAVEFYTRRMPLPTTARRSGHGCGTTLQLLLTYPKARNPEVSAASVVIVMVANLVITQLLLT